MLSRDELKTFSQTSAWRTSLSLFFDWLGIAALFTLLVYYPHPLTYVFCFILLGRQQLALAIMMHDGAHGRLYKNPKVNDYLGQMFTASAVFFSQDSYRKFHLKHHMAPLVADDPDISLIGGYPIPAKSFRRKLLRDLFGVSYFKFIGYFFYKPRKKKVPPSPPPSPQRGEGDKAQHKRLPMWYQVLSVVLVNGLVLGSLWTAGHPEYYFFFWILPMMTVLQVLLRIRGIAEHAGYEANANQMLCSRTITNPLQTFFLRASSGELSHRASSISQRALFPFTRSASFNEGKEKSAGKKSLHKLRTNCSRADIIMKQCMPKTMTEEHGASRARGNG